ncbi:putative Ig domain-containing protein [Agromyces aerolatus]|uniref:putative Ig domain-containing protein n=1 Tax=Agromyces sp. LY-1074 TaxID=3074080 RepID=UPI00285849CC|nr:MULTISPECIES: putative Ig domain-containing protein [unclassified Agromyces]MDR5698757.1 putative Ig domain-containing protein [Agromyces sp. LY-1074]MDR5705051.1 putative Ig domain-containing protein [Agromyces sp. LY-1358]
MWKTAPHQPVTPSRPTAHDDPPRRPRWRRAAVAIGLAAALVGAGTAPVFAAPGTQGVIEWGAANRPLPVPAEAGSNVTAVAASKSNPPHALALRADGSVIGWGNNGSGQATPPPAAQSGVIAIAAGSSHSLALKSDGSVIGWGSNGQGETTIPPAAQSGVVDIAAGSLVSLAAKADGTVVAWGASTQVTAPSGGFPTGVTAVEVAFGWAVALKSDGTVVSWGSPGSPTPPPGLSGVVAISAGLDHALALKSDGSVVGWGNNFANQVPPPPAASSGVIAVAAGVSHSLALKSDGSVIGWGNSVAATPIPEAGSGVVAIAAGSDTSLAVKDLGAAPTIAGTPPAGAVGEPYSFAYTVTGVPAATTTVTSGSLPPGVTLSADGVLSGAPTASGEYAFEVTASNGVSPDAVIASTITVQQAPTISGTPPNGAVGTAYSFAYSVTGVPAPTVTLQAGAPLPPGLSLSPEGVISGTPTTVGTYSFAVEASNGVDPTALLGSTITVNEGPAISGTPPAGIVGSGYSFTYTVTGTPTPTVSLASGTLPPGLTLSSAGVLSGTPTTAGTFTFTVGASNGVGSDATVTSTVTIQAASKPKADVSVAITGPSTAKKGTPVSYVVTVRNAGPQQAVNVHSTLLVSSDFTIQTIPSGATKVGQLVIFPTASFATNQQRQYSVTLLPKANSGTAHLAAATASLVTGDPKLTNNAAALSVKLTK